jgi:hypothetical protein
VNTEMNEHQRFKYSATIHTEDEAVLNCLRALAQFTSRDGNARISWGGTKKQQWESAGHTAAFRFTSPEWHNHFLVEYARLLPHDLWHMTSNSDNDPATPQETT